MHSTAREIVDLQENYVDEQGWILCGHCRGRGFIRKEYEVQEGGNPWKPYIRAMIPLKDYDGDDYQPFVFLTGETKSGAIDGVWVCYYKDLRSRGGRLKIGHGPGGPPVLWPTDIAEILVAAVKMGCMNGDAIMEVLRNELGTKGSI